MYVWTIHLRIPLTVPHVVLYRSSVKVITFCNMHPTGCFSLHAPCSLQGGFRYMHPAVYRVFFVTCTLQSTGCFSLHAPCSLQGVFRYMHPAVYRVFFVTCTLQSTGWFSLHAPDSLQGASRCASCAFWGQFTGCNSSCAFGRNETRMRSKLRNKAFMMRRQRGGGTSDSQ